MPNVNENRDKYRGLGHDVSACDSTQCILDAAHLNWKVVPMPLQIVGKSETRPWDRCKALVRSDNGVALEPCTKVYNPFQNGQIVDAMRSASDIGGFRIESAGALDEGRRVWAEGTLPGRSFELAPRHEAKLRSDLRGFPGHERVDKTILRMRMSSGHVPGMAFVMSLVAHRLICSNGMELTAALGTFRMNHRGTFDQGTVTRIRKLIEDSGVVFHDYEANARLMWDTAADVEMSQAFVIQLLQPQIFTKMVEDGRVSKQVLGTQGNFRVFNGFNTTILLNEVVDRHLMTEEVSGMINRAGKRVLELITSQPGADQNPGTLWQTYNAVTYFVDHERGRTADSGLNAAMFGEGRQIKAEALDLAVQYAEADPYDVLNLSSK